MSKCKSCYFHDLTVGSCDYFLLTGVRRGCELGLCNKWTPRAKRRAGFELPGEGQTESRRERVYTAMWALYDQDLNDSQIAELIGYSSEAVAKWRLKMKLSPVSQKRMGQGGYE